MPPKKSKSSIKAVKAKVKSNAKPKTTASSKSVKASPAKNTGKTKTKAVAIEEPEFDPDETYELSSPTEKYMDFESEPELDTDDEQEEKGDQSIASQKGKKLLHRDIDSEDEDEDKDAKDPPQMFEEKYHEPDHFDDSDLFIPADIFENEIVEHPYPEQATAMAAESKRGRGRPRKTPAASAPPARTSIYTAPKAKANLPRMTDAEIEKHQHMVMKLTRYGDSAVFGQYLRKNHMQFEGLDREPMDRLEEIHKRIKILIGNRSGGGLLYHGVIKGAAGLEKAVSWSKLKDSVDLTGYSMALSQDPNLEATLEEISLEYGIATCVSPWWRLGMTLTHTAGQVAAANFGQKMMQQYMLQQQKPAVIQQQPSKQPAPQPSASEPSIIKTSPAASSTSSMAEAPMVF